MPRERLERIARNEASFRAINENLEDGLRQVPHLPDRPRFICECGRQDCAQTIELSFAEYEDVRRDSRRFAIVTGHSMPEAERIVADHGRYQVVEKHARFAALTDAEDERRPGPGGLRATD